MDADQMLFHAVNLIDAGNKAGGREILKQIVAEQPYNTDVLYIYAQYCGRRDQAVAALEQVLALEPEYPGAREALDRIAQLPATQPLKSQPLQSAFVALEQDDPWQKSLQPEPGAPPIVPGDTHVKSNKSKGLPKWLMITAASLVGLLIIGGLTAAAFWLTTNNPGLFQIAAAPSPSPTAEIIPVTAPISLPTATLQPYSTPTATPDPCTCEAVSAYMNLHLPRVNQLLDQMSFTAKKLKKNSLKESDIATLVQNATQMYNDQRAENVPACLASYQKDAVQMFWTWNQAATALQNGDANGVQAFMDVITADAEQVDEKMTKLMTYPTLQGCDLVLPTIAAP